MYHIIQISINISKIFKIHRILFKPGIKKKTFTTQQNRTELMMKICDRKAIRLYSVINQVNNSPNPAKPEISKVKALAVRHIPYFRNAAERDAWALKM